MSPLGFWSEFYWLCGSLTTAVGSFEWQWIPGDTRKKKFRKKLLYTFDKYGVQTYSDWFSNLEKIFFDLPFMRSPYAQKKSRICMKNQNSAHDLTNLQCEPAKKNVTNKFWEITMAPNRTIAKKFIPVFRRWNFFWKCLRKFSRFDIERDTLLQREKTCFYQENVSFLKKIFGKKIADPDWSWKQRKRII